MAPPPHEESRRMPRTDSSSSDMLSLGEQDSSAGAGLSRGSACGDQGESPIPASLPASSRHASPSPGATAPPTPASPSAALLAKGGSLPAPSKHPLSRASPAAQPLASASTTTRGTPCTAAPAPAPASEHSSRSKLTSAELLLLLSPSIASSANLTSAPGPYSCKTCAAKFPSLHALGYHQAHHRRSSGTSSLLPTRTSPKAGSSQPDLPSVPAGRGKRRPAPPPVVPVGSEGMGEVGPAQPVIESPSLAPLGRKRSSPGKRATSEKGAKRGSDAKKQKPSPSLHVSDQDGRSAKSAPVQAEHGSSAVAAASKGTGFQCQGQSSRAPVLVQPPQGMTTSLAPSSESGLPAGESRTVLSQEHKVVRPTVSRASPPGHQQPSHLSSITEHVTQHQQQQQQQQQQPHHLSAPVGPHSVPVLSSRPHLRLPAPLILPGGAAGDMGPDSKASVVSQARSELTGEGDGVLSRGQPSPTTPCNLLPASPFGMAPTSPFSKYSMERTQAIPHKSWAATPCDGASRLPAVAAPAPVDAPGPFGALPSDPAVFALGPDTPPRHQGQVQPQKPQMSMLAELTNALHQHQHQQQQQQQQQWLTVSGVPKPGTALSSQYASVGQQQQLAVQFQHELAAQLQQQHQLLTPTSGHHPNSTSYPGAQPGACCGLKCSAQGIPCIASPTTLSCVLSLLSAVTSAAVAQGVSSPGGTSKTHSGASSCLEETCHNLPVAPTTFAAAAAAGTEIDLELHL